MYSQSTSHCKQHRQHRPLLFEVRIKISFILFLYIVGNSTAELYASAFTSDFFGRVMQFSLHGTLKSMLIHSTLEHVAIMNWSVHLSIHAIWKGFLYIAFFFP